MCATGALGTVTRPNIQSGPEPHSGAGGAYNWYLVAEARPGEVPAARHAARQALTDWRLGPVAADAELVLNELLANAVQATRATTPAGRKVTACMALDLDRLYILVWDCCPQPPVHAGPADHDAENGRGLEIVAALADCWGTVPLPGGKVVWARLAVTRQEAQ
jgi:anti-sigma regulatory factor (Ser/Thr protein kinase)